MLNPSRRLNSKLVVMTKEAAVAAISNPIQKKRKEEVAFGEAMKTTMKVAGNVDVKRATTQTSIIDPFSFLLKILPVCSPYDGFRERPNVECQQDRNV